MKRKDKSPYSAIESRPKGWENPIKTLKRWKENVICAYQRIRYGYCYRDVWSIDDWFLHIVPNMLLDLKAIAHGYPASLEVTSDYDDEEAMQQWEDILGEMAFLLQEANEETCQRENPYDDIYHEKWKEFTDTYGFRGEKLLTEEEKAREKKTGYLIQHSMDELPEYKEISEKYFQERKKLSEYREGCRNEGLALFQKWFTNLWD